VREGVARPPLPRERVPAEGVEAALARLERDRLLRGGQRPGGVPPRESRPARVVRLVGGPGPEERREALPVARLAEVAPGTRSREGGWLAKSPSTQLSERPSASRTKVSWRLTAARGSYPARAMYSMP
jgi:hypothetical protein